MKLMGTMSMNSNAMYVHARQRSADILIQRMPGPPGTCRNMLSLAGAKTYLARPMLLRMLMTFAQRLLVVSYEPGQSQLRSREKGNEKSLTVIANIHALRPGRLSYSLMGLPLPNVLGRAEIVCWVAESLRPFDIVTDQGFQSLMKTGRLEYYLPSAETIARDVRQVFVHSHQRVAKMLKVSRN